MRLTRYFLIHVGMHHTTRCKVQHNRQRSYTSTLPSMQITMLATSKDQYQNPNIFSADTDGVYFIINNSANGGICNIKSMFAGNFEQQIVTLVTAEGRTTTVKQVRNIHLVLKDDTGKNWSYDISEVVYDPELPNSLLGIPFLGKYAARNDKENECWMRCRHCRQIIQEMNNLLAEQIIQDMNNLLAESR
jgi:hypothetical protein